ncbi:hypothetical protein CERSUDRAFT_99095 [Gelatoporia subvermispora B]|uniref:Uncharacterized protein n=1 Tax=Ceriporiopsis subvermispora (strain B) TaxID=914234 RepID=M2Q7A2_CERS8|nr:hypothetical protein CERSUDRAFT_99095 [Gelatoporia subvermispora B]
MSVGMLKRSPYHFCLQDLTSITAPVFEFKLNPNQDLAWAKTSVWFDSHNVYYGEKKTGFFSHRFDAFAGMGFPDADTDHVDNCVAFFLWAFSDLCSFNAGGDFQNLVFHIMLERDCGLQTAVDILTGMLAQRVIDYAELKKQLPSFGPSVDSELARYLKALEQYVQGTVVWYYMSPRYFRGQDVSNRKNLVVPVFERTAPDAEPDHFEVQETDQHVYVRPPVPAYAS